jgi:malonyl CoA-acyl carrier protein transacylase
MAADFVEQFPAARAVFDEASDALSLDLVALCAGDPRLDLTEFTQPAIVTAELAILAALRNDFGFEAQRYGGHSLGEYTALVAAGALGLPDAVRLVRQRGRLMQEAVAVGCGGMTAVIQPGLDHDAVARLALACEVDVANYNAPSQIVLSGLTDALTQAAARLEETGARTVAIEVSAPFHSRHLAIIEPAFGWALAETSFQREHVSVVTSNFTGVFHEPDLFLDALTRQISGSVRWVDNMRTLASGADRIIEIGPGKPLSRFFKELGREVLSIVNVRTAERVLRAAV